METGKKKFKITKIEYDRKKFDRKRFNIKKMEYYEELEEVDKEANMNLLRLGLSVIVITLLGITLPKVMENVSCSWGSIQIVIIYLNIELALDNARNLVDAIPQQKMLAKKIKELNDLLNAEEPKKLVLSKKWRK